MRYCILQSLRLAFHYAFDLFLMGEFDVPSQQELEVKFHCINNSFQKEVDVIDNEWFFAGEEFLWNLAIEKNLPNLERIIENKGSYYAHRLKYG